MEVELLMPYARLYGIIIVLFFHEIINEKVKSCLKDQIILGFRDT